jgi:hypothetical protein
VGFKVGYFLSEVSNLTSPINRTPSMLFALSVNFKSAILASFETGLIAMKFYLHHLLCFLAFYGVKSFIVLAQTG